jgi:tetratricopeptide (TPR) repeat protein
VFNQITPISNPHGRGLPTISHVILIVILLAWIGPPADSLTTQAGDSARGAANSAEDDLSVGLGKPIERELSGGQSHLYKITMTSGQYLRITVGQRGIDVSVTLFTPDDKRVYEIDMESVTEGTETVSAIAEEDGAYKIEIRCSEKSAKTGRYEIKVEELREATAEDKYRVAADSVFRDAEKLSRGTLEEKRKGIEKYQVALVLYRRAGARRGESETLNNVGAVYHTIGEMQKALENYNEALPILREIGEREGEAIVLNNIGMINFSRGYLKKALDTFNESLTIKRTLGNRADEATILNNIGGIYRLSGEMQKALNVFNESLALRRAAGDRRGEANTLNSIGGVYQSLEETQKALNIFNESLTIRRMVGDRTGEAATLGNIGGVYQSIGELQKALETYNEVLPIFREFGDREGEAIALNNIGYSYRLLNRMPEALEKYNESLTIWRMIGDRKGEAGTLHNIGKVYLSLGEINAALGKFNEALTIRRATGDRDGEAEALLGIALVEQKQGKLIEARQTMEEAIDLVESVRTSVDIQELRASYLASRREYYQFYIDILMEQRRQNPSAEFDAQALAVSERSRARSLLELLTESRADIRQGVDSSLLERERSLQRLLNAKAAAQFSLLSRKHTPAQAEAAAKEIVSITTEYEELRAQIRARNPRYADLTQPQPLSLAEIQQQVLDPDTLLLEYFLGADASYLFVVSQTSISSHRLPKRAEVEAATRRVRELLTAPQPQRGDTWAKYQARIKEARANYWPQAAELSRMLLGPAAPQLGGKRLLIVADGALQYLPFGALPAPETGRQRDGETRRQGERGTRRRGEKGNPQSPIRNLLIAEHEIVYLPSASTLGVLRRELAGRKPAAKTVAVLADPVFDKDDARVKSSDIAQAGQEAPPDLTRAINDVRGELKRLLLTRDEAEAILSVAPGTDGFGALDFRANRATVTSDELSRYRIVHFATHGLLNSEHPELSGVVLSLVDERGQPQDGFLRLHEIFNLRLPAELVVLSACQTGLGKEVKGEGLVGLTRGFMYAGAARVVASLWQVDDAATAELMKRFYRRMLKDGMRPAAALRAAQIEMWRRPQWQSPYYWCGFVLQGEWK